MKKIDHLEKKLNKNKKIFFLEKRNSNGNERILEKRIKNFKRIKRKIKLYYIKEYREHFNLDTKFLVNINNKTTFLENLKEIYKNLEKSHKEYDIRKIIYFLNKALKLYEYYNVDKNHVKFIYFLIKDLDKIKDTEKRYFSFSEEEKDLIGLLSVMRKIIYELENNKKYL
ncbi:MAG: hypothetical protein NZZ41_06150 [Candidatus Dojkabacteria bacterium]|nr:hypothetical protein [Candidatus Dojkabacteria bacterium]